jgi:hypothetical protein
MSRRPFSIYYNGSGGGSFLRTYSSMLGLVISKKGLSTYAASRRTYSGSRFGSRSTYFSCTNDGSGIRGQYYSGVVLSRRKLHKSNAVIMTNALNDMKGIVMKPAYWNGTVAQPTPFAEHVMGTAPTGMNFCSAYW